MNHPKKHKFELVFPLIFLFFIFTPKIEAQQRKTQLMGRVVNVATKAPVSFCMIFNQTSGESTYTDSLGYFKIYSDIGDTMVYSRIGYLHKELVVAPGTIARFQTIELAEHAYELKTVNIEGFGTYQQFKYKVINTPLPEAKEKINPYLGFNEKIVVLKPQASIPLGSPVTAVICY
ncbi:MAG: carboxypeptidase-like regulatory domain-containing protein [Bacteroidetes bacterium]|nr:carboxypeptidase-like regulatory domain-containing protein [Bacteroidota bacterium]